MVDHLIRLHDVIEENGSNQEINDKEQERENGEGTDRKRLLDKADTVMKASLSRLTRSPLTLIPFAYYLIKSAPSAAKVEAFLSPHVDGALLPLFLSNAVHAQSIHL